MIDRQCAAATVAALRTLGRLMRKRLASERVQLACRRVLVRGARVRLAGHAPRAASQLEPLEPRGGECAQSQRLCRAAGARKDKANL